MAKIKLTSGFTVIPEGTHVFKITAVDYKKDFGKLQVTMQTEKGDKHIERFTLLDREGEPNQGAYNAFSFFAKTALNDFTLTEIDHEDLVGCFMECDVEHDIQPNRNDPSKNVTFVRLADKRPSDGWTETPAVTSAHRRGGKPNYRKPSSAVNMLCPGKICCGVSAGKQGKLICHSPLRRVHGECDCEHAKLPCEVGECPFKWCKKNSEYQNFLKELNA